MSIATRTSDAAVTIAQALGRGLEEHRAGRFPDAIRIYRLILEKQPALAEAHSNLAAALQASGQLDAAAASYREALRLRPDLPALHSNLGTVLQSMGRLEDALASYEAAQALQPEHPDAHCNLSAVLERLGRLDEAEACARTALKLDARHARAHNNLATILRARGRLDESIAQYQRAIALKPGYEVARSNLIAAQELKRNRRRLEQLRETVRRSPRDAAARTRLGDVLHEQKMTDEAIECYRAVLAAKPTFIDALVGLGAALMERGEVDEAILTLNAALAIDKERAEAHNNLGSALLRAGRYDEAVSAFQAAVDRKPGVYAYQLNLGAALGQAGRGDEEIAVYRRALALAPKVADVHRKLANALLSQRLYDEAIPYYESALKLQPQSAQTLRYLGAAMWESHRREEAVPYFRQAARLDPDDVEVLSALAHSLQHFCSWEEWTALQPTLLAPASIQSGKHNLFNLISTDSTPEDQLVAARSAGRSLEQRKDAYTAWPHTGDKLRVGYLSADFREHPVAYLTAELFELHDPERFEVHAYALFGSQDQSEVRARIARSAHRFTDVHALSTREIAARIHEDGINVLVDLTGYTQHSRTGVLALKPAPVQVSFLGFPATMGASFIQYLITDRFVTPPQAEAGYAEKFVYMPHCFQPNDRTKAIAEHAPSRAECGLSQASFVFCSFNKTYKITPRIFDVWMRLLRAVPGSVLWLSRETACENLAREARARGVDPQRLVFAAKLDSMAEHLARHRHADLFLDTLPYNAHTTASDALWTGLPVITCIGETFASRVAGSLLHAIGLPELVTNSLKEYESLALALARDPLRLGAVRARLQQNRFSHPLFDSVRYTRDLERAYELMWERFQRGEPPALIDVAADAKKSP